MLIYVASTEVYMIEFFPRTREMFKSERKGCDKMQFYFSFPLYAIGKSYFSFERKNRQKNRELVELNLLGLLSVSFIKIGVFFKYFSPIFEDAFDPYFACLSSRQENLNEMGRSL